jgi:MFS family permease
VSEQGETDWDALSEFAQQREDINPYLLRGMLANALRKRGYAAIVAPEDGKGPQPKKRVLPNILAYTALWSFGTSGAIAAGTPWYLWPVAILAALGVILWLNSFDRDSQWIGAVVLLGWVVLGIAQTIEGSFETLTITYLAPLALGAAYGLATRVLRLREAQDLAMALGGVVKSAPLIAPVVLVVLFLPTLSADVWQVADKLSPTSLLIVGAASVGLLFIVVRLQLGSETEQTVEVRARQLCDLSERSELTRGQLTTADGEENGPLLESMADSSLEEAWPAAGEEYAPYLHATGGETLRSPLTGRLALTVGVVGVLFSAYIYVLCSAVVPSGLAAEWTGASAPAAQIELLGLTVTLYGGAFLNLAALLGLAATATFLSFALIEERFAKALAGALLQDPTDRFLVLALPYVTLWEEAIEQGRAERQPPSS